ncbi:MAG: hypothetical protein HFJ50_08190 [Clostridia bacterium]|jgi:hypothetical protein|nr:hypothetical protein [Clostridia bacterium]
MNKKSIFILCALVLFFGTAYITTLKLDEEKEEIKSVEEIGEIEVNVQKIENTVAVSTEEVKTTPSTKLVLKKVYGDCEHSDEEESIIPEEMVNLSKEEMAEKYKSWEIEKFEKDKVVLTKEVASFCGEHFLVKEEQGCVSIYNLDEEGNTSLKEVADIAYEYLPETDKIILKNGIYVYGVEALNKIKEDYEA